MFTVPTLTGKVYVVTSLELISQIQRHPKIFSFSYLEALFGTQLATVSKEAGQKILRYVHRDQGEANLFDDGIKFMSKCLRPGKWLDELNRVMAYSICSSLDRLDSSLQNGRRKIDLWDWVTHEMTMATTEAVYGPLNPYKDPNVESAFWDLSDNVSFLLMGILPSLIARKAYLGRKKMFEAFENYAAAGGLKQASNMTKGKYEIAENHGVSQKDTARLEGTQGMTILANTVPSAFWILYHVLSKNDVLKSVRHRAEELMAIETRKGTPTRVININKLREDPVLSSVAQEALRHQAFGSPTRMVMEDTMLDDRYFLKKGTTIMMPNEAIHLDASIWGNPEDFDPKRFIAKGSEKVPKGAFRTFGGGANYCPGRLFAMTEMLLMVVMVALRYDVFPVDRGEWQIPPLDGANMSAIVTPPKGKVPVWVSRRKGSEDQAWAFEL